MWVLMCFDVCYVRALMCVDVYVMYVRVCDRL